MALIRCGFLDCSNSFNCFSARKGLAECVCSVRLPALTAPVGFAPTKVVTSDSVCHKLQPVLTGNLSFPQCYIKVQEKRQPLVEKYRQLLVLELATRMSFSETPHSLPRYVRDHWSPGMPEIWAGGRYLSDPFTHLFIYICQVSAIHYVIGTVI